MGIPYLGELKLMSFNFAPKGGAQCNGQFLPINQNQALFSLLGTTYGGNGQTTFALPDFRGRVVVGTGQGPGLSNYVLGQVGGQAPVTISFTLVSAVNVYGSTGSNNVYQVTGTPGTTSLVDESNTDAVVIGSLAGTVFAYGRPG